MKITPAILALGTMMASLSAPAAIIFSDDFSSTPTNLNQWTIETYSTPVIADGVLEMNPPASGYWRTSLTTTASWTAPGKYELDFTGLPGLASTADQRGYSRVFMPGGLELRWMDWNNGLDVYYQGVKINSSWVAAGKYSYDEMAPYKLVQNGRSVQLYVGAESIANALPDFTATVASDPDFIGYGNIILFDRYPVFSQYDSVSLSYEVPEPTALCLLVLLVGGVSMRRQYK